MSEPQSMRLKTIGVPKEIRGGERRVILLPKSVEELVKRGWRVIVERGAGGGISVGDSAYQQAGAQIEDTEAVWTLADIVVKYKAPVPEEFRFFRRGLTLTGILHAEGDPVLTAALLESNVAAYSYEFFQTADGCFPLAVAGGRIAGRMAALYGVWLLQAHHGGLGKAPGFQHDGADAVNCVVIGSGNVGGAATEALLALGCRVTLLTSGIDGQNRAEARFGAYGDNLGIQINSGDVLASSIAASDLVIGAVLISTFDTAPMVTEDVVRSMRAGSVLVDATAGYGGGYMPTFDRQTSLESPLFAKHGVLHCKIDNYPAAVPATAVQLVNTIYTPYLIVLLESLRTGTEDPVSQRGLVTCDGKIVHAEVLRHAKHWKLSR